MTIDVKRNISYGEWQLRLRKLLTDFDPNIILDFGGNVISELLEMDQSDRPCIKGCIEGTGSGKCIFHI